MVTSQLRAFRLLLHVFLLSTVALGNETGSKYFQLLGIGQYQEDIVCQISNNMCINYIELSTATSVDACYAYAKHVPDCFKGGKILNWNAKSGECRCSRDSCHSRFRRSSQGFSVCENRSSQPKCADDNSSTAWLDVYSCATLQSIGWCHSGSYITQTQDRCPETCNACTYSIAKKTTTNILCSGVEVFLPVTQEQCPDDRNFLPDCHFDMAFGDLCDAESPLPDGRIEYEIDNCGGYAVFQYICQPDENVIDWIAGFGDVSARAMEAEVGDILTFEWPGVQNVYQMSSLEAFESCDFSSATLIGAESGAQATIDSLPAYFACEIAGHCLVGQKLAVTAVHDTEYLLKTKPALQGYQHIARGCVSGANIVLYKDKNIDECAELCNGNNACKAFEYGVNYGGSGRYKARDCQLQSSAVSYGCRGSTHNLDLYIKPVDELFTVSGDCDVVDNCVSSRNWPNAHGDNEECEVTIVAGVVFLFVGNPFELEHCCDRLEFDLDMDGEIDERDDFYYYGQYFDIQDTHDIPHQMTAGQKIHWSSHESYLNQPVGGWQICFDDEPSRPFSSANRSKMSMAQTVLAGITSTSDIVVMGFAFIGFASIFLFGYKRIATKEYKQIEPQV